MPTLNIRTDEATEKALQALTAKGRTKTEAVRYALLHTYRDELIKQAREDAERLANDPDDRAEMLAIQRYMGVSE
ncbi:type II toxin-antitoxin system VapB family antitoxin [Glycomyces tenuis]|uniref:type II toxin-antitoxin system VapB family antitoxin n=1 Tax=Glycomyces tenuis TaxID=58116 RepID=UPI00068917C8|nr:type II toxin-antitoxin system VapB family antitoxin [Glycomyces tenuis]